MSWLFQMFCRPLDGYFTSSLARQQFPVESVESEVCGLSWVIRGLFLDRHFATESVKCHFLSYFNGMRESLFMSHALGGGEYLEQWRCRNKQKKKKLFAWLDTMGNKKVNLYFYDLGELTLYWNCMYCGPTRKSFVILSFIKNHPILSDKYYKRLTQHQHVSIRCVSIISAFYKTDATAGLHVVSVVESHESQHFMLFLRLQPSLSTSCW